MSPDDGVIGDDPLVAGMRLSLRLRRDFVITDPDRLLAAARDVYRELTPGADVGQAQATVTGAADALFVILEHAGLLGEVVDERLASHAPNGLALGGSRAQIVINEPAPLAPGPRTDCLREKDVFALPPDDQ